MTSSKLISSIWYIIPFTEIVGLDNIVEAVLCNDILILYWYTTLLIIGEDCVYISDFVIINVSVPETWFTSCENM